MLMRLKPLRGQKFIVEGEELTLLEVLKEGKSDMCSFVLPSGKLASISKTRLGLPTINTKDYERVTS